MAKSKGRLLAELLASDGKVKESKSALDISGGKLAPSDIPTLPNSKLENSSISIAGHNTALGGSVTLNTGDIGEHTNYKYYTDARVGSYLSTNGYATQSTIVGAITDSAPATLDTLNELAAALGDDANFSTTVTNSIATKLPLAGGTITGNLNLGDNVKAQFGTGDDLRLYHNGTTNNSNIENHTGGLFVTNYQDDGNIVFRSDDGSGGVAEYIVVDGGSGSTLLKHYGSTKLVTTSTGIDVTGTATVDGLTVNSGNTSSNLSIRNGSNSSFLNIYSDLNGVALLDVDGANVGGAPRFQIDVGNVQTFRILEGGDISFYEDTGTTAKFFWDASAERLGIGTTNPSEKLQVDGNIALNGELKLVTAIRHANSGAQVIDNDNDTYFIINDPEGSNRIKIGDSGDRTTTIRNDTLKFEKADGTLALTIASLNATFAGTISSTGQHYVGSNVVWNAGNDGSGSGLDADLLDGLQLHTGRNHDANKVVRTNSSGYIDTGWINTTSGARTTQAITRVYASDDAYIRYYTLANFGDQIASHINYNSLENKPTITTLSNGANNRIVTATGTSSLDAEANLQYDGSALDIYTAGNAVTDNHVGLTFRLTGTYSDGRYEHRFRKRDEGGGIPLYIDKTESTANFHTAIARFGSYTSNTEEFEVYGAAKVSGALSVTGSISGTTATAAGGTNTTALASTAFVQQEITSLVGGAPTALDTLNELAAAINDDSNYNTTLTTALGTKLPKAGGTMTGVLNMGSQNITNASDIGMATGHSSGKFAVMASSVHGSYDFYNNGTSYFNGTVAVDANLTISGGGAILGSPNITAGRVITTGLYGTGHGSSMLPIWQYNSGHHGYGFGYVEGSPDSFKFDVSNNLVSGTPDFEISENVARVNGNTVWHAGNDGSGSGLDADLLDGQHGSYYRNAGNINAGILPIARIPTSLMRATGTEYTSATNWSSGIFPLTSDNVLNWSTVHNSTSSWGDSPQATFSSAYTYGGVENVKLGAMQIQTYYPHSGSAGNGVYYRTGWESSGSSPYFHSWAKFYDTNNDGSGSGLDADTVDGIQGASFLRSDAADTGSGKITLTAAEGLEVFGIRGRAVGSQTGDFIQMYERVSIGYPSGWGAGGANSAPTQGLTTYGGALFNTGNVSGAPLTFNGNTIWRADNDGSGSGLDADLLDGYHGNNYIGKNGNGYYQPNAWIDFNTTGDGLYWSGGTGAGWHIYPQSTEDLRLRSGATGSVGLALETSGTKRGYVYANSSNQIGFLNQNRAWRFKVPSSGSVYRDSYVVWDAGNDGSGSGLDADLLDGTHKSGFFVQSGSWLGDLGSNGYTRENGLSMTGGSEFTLLSKNGQGTVLVDGQYISYESSNGFFGSYDSSYANAAGIRATAASTVTVQKLNGNNASLAVTGNITRSGNTVWDAGNDGTGSGLDADLLDGWHRDNITQAEASQTWSSIAASSTQAKRYHIARLYACPAHWDSDWQNIELHVTAESYEAGTLKYKIHGNYGGAGTQASMIQMHLTEAYGDMIPRFRIILSSPVDAGWDHSGQDTYYVDVFAEASHYSNWKIHAKTFGHGVLSSNPTSGGAKTVFYSSPSASNISTFSETHTQSTIRLDTSNIQTQKAQTKLKAHSNGWDGGLALISNDGSDTFQMHPDNNGYMYVDKTWYFTAAPHVGSIGSPLWHPGNDGSGSGLDADLLDGVQGANFLRSDVHDTGVGLTINGGTLNSPTDATLFVTASNSNDWGIRIGASSGKIEYGQVIEMPASFSHAFRVLKNGSEHFNINSTGATIGGNYIWHAGNDGSGSGLDADHLDGSTWGTQTKAVAARNWTTEAGDGQGLTFWGGTGTALAGSYAIAMSSQGNGNAGRHSLDSSSDYNMYFKMSGGTDRGFVFKNSGTNVAAITNSGRFLGSAVYLDGSSSQNQYVAADSTHSLTIRNMGATNSGGLVMQGSSGAHGLQLYWDSGGYGFLDGAWAGWDIQKVPNGAFKVDEGSGLKRVLNEANWGSYITLPTDTNTIDGRGFVNTGSNSGQNADTINSNGISYYTSGVTNFSGNATDGALYSQQYSSSWQHQIAGDYRSGQIALRGKNNGTWQAWRKVWDVSNDGSGSGLDADLLDGQDSSYYRSASNLNAGTVPTGQMPKILPTSGNYVWSASTAASGYSPVGISTSFVRSNEGWPNYGTVLHVGGRGGSDAGGDFQLFSGHGAANGGNYLRVRNSDNSASPTDSWTAFRTIWDSGNDGSGSGLDADLLDGANSDTAANANTIVKRDGNGYINAVYINSAIGISETLSLDLTKIYMSNDNYIRTMGKSDFKVRMGLTNSDYDRMDYATPSNYHTGANSHNDTTFNGLLQRGCGFIDNWNSGAGKPPTGSHYNGFQAMHYASGSSYFHGMQMVMSAGNPSNTYLRGWWANGGSGYGWQKIWTDGNDGSGSGLDADLLDGIQASGFIQSGGSWNASNMPGSRHVGLGVNGGEVVFQRDNPNNGQMSVMVDGNFYAGENNGFWSLYSGNNYNAKVGMYSNTSGHLLLSTSSAYAGGNKIWHAGNDGSGSGLDADLLDGIDSTYFNRGDNAYGVIAGASGWNMNDLFTARNRAGFFDVWSGSNFPSGTTHVHGIQVRHNSSAHYGWQLAGQYGQNKLYHRQVSNNSWGSWDTMWSSGNDGSGSGLDADLLDGMNAAGSGGSIIMKTESNGYSQLNNWTQVGGAGLYSATTNGAHWYPNAAVSYGTWRSNGSRNGYCGIYHDYGGVVSSMYDSGGNGGDWNGTNGWQWYWHRGNSCLAVGGSTTSSSYSLQVGGAIYSSGNITAYSDRRVKENIIPIDNALEKVNGLQGVYYNRIDDEDKTKEIGFIAQEVNEVAPELVTYAEDIDQYGVKYGNTTALLVEAVKELTQQVKDLKQEIEEIKNVK